MSQPRTAQELRRACVDVAGRRLLIAQYAGTAQERDLTLPANCDGLGRVHHFRRHGRKDWPVNRVPIDPACRALGRATTDEMQAQVFQLAACNWHCWYCFVPRELLGARTQSSRWVTSAELVRLYSALDPRPQIIDLSGGQPDLVPEWVPWMMEELREQNLENSVYLWSDDNLSGDFFWDHLSTAQRSLITSYRNYGRVGCFKGYDARSFAFNTGAPPEEFDRQFWRMARLVELGVDIYAYATFTTPDISRLPQAMSAFVDRLQGIHQNFPLRVVPLYIHPFTPVTTRLTRERLDALELQLQVAEGWQSELTRRFSASDLAMGITDVPIK